MGEFKFIFTREYQRPLRAVLTDIRYKKAYPVVTADDLFYKIEDAGGSLAGVLILAVSNIMQSCIIKFFELRVPFASYEKDISHRISDFVQSGAWKRNFLFYKQTNPVRLFTSNNVDTSNISYGFHADMNYNPISLSDAPLQALLSSEYGSKLKLIKYPGGDISQTFDWETGEDDGGSPFPNTLNDLLSIHNANGYDILWVVNMCSKDLPNQLAMLAQWKALSGQDPKYIALGSEMNRIGSYQHSVYPTAASYMAAAATWAAAFKGAYPSIKNCIWGENKGWSPNWNDLAVAVPNIDGINTHIGIDPSKFSTNGVPNLTVLNTLIDTSWINSGMNLISALPVWCDEFNYQFTPATPLTIDGAYETTLFFLQKISALVNESGNPDLKIMCLRRLVANEGAVAANYTLTPDTGLAMKTFLSNVQ